MICALAGDSVIETMVSAEGKKPPQLPSSSADTNVAAILPHQQNRCTFIILYPVSYRHFQES